ncbi:MAG: hypothetical protein GWN84_20760 [Gammaproteobacteria bacterium]|nr:hypothetical protein [Gammaproteobacteria bacterium]NIR85193.1 hypothetical protein [Gammaproteobacteria bacterium]NIU06242.1 hypothetical protein [Gammaproteobacteria bacterium]NIX87515.1 hypothetical protein [Gammaproteobacteria bacterium]
MSGSNRYAARCAACPTRLAPRQGTYYLGRLYCLGCLTKAMKQDRGQGLCPEVKS